MFGDLIVYRESRDGRVIMANRPRRPDTPTAHQLKFRSKFMQAVQYAKSQMLDETAKAEYAAAVTSNMVSAYGVAVADYLKGPEIVDINVAGYTG